MEYGRILATRGIASEAESNITFTHEITAAFERYKRNDWGDLCKDDKELNDQAVKDGGRILAAYQTCKGKI